MSKYLVVIESPGKLKSYRKYLGPEYDIVASMGHVMDLPQRGGIGVDVKNEFKPTYEVIPGKETIISSIVDKAERADLVYLMTDPDREGSGIASMIASQFPKSVKYKRASTAAITKSAILQAIENAGEIDHNMVESFETRRILDRLVGWLTSFLVTQATGGKSAGRVQSAALRILAEREKEIRSFKPEEYWPVQAELLTPDKKKVIALVVDPDRMDTKNEKQAKAVADNIEKGPVKVASYDTKTVNSNPFPPFTTSQLQARAASMFGWNQDRTMKVAQTLYEQGRITYMRTDSTHIEAGPLSQIRDAIVEKYQQKYLSEKINTYKSGKNAQEAHEAIRPTDISVDVAGTGDEQKLYSLIWKRTVASQMKPEVREQVRATFKSNGVVLASSGSRQLFDGWKRCWDYTDPTDTFLPEMKVGDKMDVLDVTYEQKFTEPPPRYGVATFNSKLEEMGIARPSTLATVTKTLQSRGYIETNKNTHHVTDLGLRVVDFLVGAGFCFADVNFTKEMEDKLDDILNEQTTKKEVLDAFWKRFKAEIDAAKKKKADDNKTEFPCPQCAKKGIEKFLVRKFSKFGPFFSCEARKEEGVMCDFMGVEDENHNPVAKVKKAPPEKTGIKCPKCGNDLVRRNGRYGEFFGCASYPKCKVVADTSGVVKQSSLDSSGETKKKKFWGKKKKG